MQCLVFSFTAVISYVQVLLADLQPLVLSSPDPPEPRHAGGLCASKGGSRGGVRRATLACSALTTPRTSSKRGGPIGSMACEARHAASFLRMAALNTGASLTGGSVCDRVDE